MAGVPVNEGVLGALLSPVRVPLRAVAGLADIAGTLDRLLQAVVTLRAPLNSIDAKVTGLEDTLNVRLNAIEGRLIEMKPLLQKMNEELKETTGLLPDASDGPLARLRDTFSSS